MEKKGGKRRRERERVESRKPLLAFVCNRTVNYSCSKERELDEKCFTKGRRVRGVW